MKDAYTESDILEEPTGQYGNKPEFANQMRQETYKAMIEIVKLCDKLPYNMVNRSMVDQLVRSSDSVAANYRAACRARSDREFFAKMSIVVEEADETEMRLDKMADCGRFSKPQAEELKKTYTKILHICSKARNTVYNRLQKKKK